VTEIPQIDETLSELNSGDFLNVLGEEHLTSSKFNILEIQHVGLKDLLGQWLAPDGTVYDFLTFRHLRVEPKPSPVWSYFVLPEDGPSWSLLLVTNSGVRSARLSMGFNQIILDFYINPESDPVRIELVKVGTPEILNLYDNPISHAR